MLSSYDVPMAEGTGIEPATLYQSTAVPKRLLTIRYLPWSWQGSNLRPPESHSGTLPTELHDHCPPVTCILHQHRLLGLYRSRTGGCSYML